MVAEAVAETQVPAPEVAQQAPPSEPTPEVAEEEAPDPELIESLREGGFISEDYGRGEEAAAVTQDKGPAPDVSTLTPEQAKEAGRREEREAYNRQQADTQRQNYEAGVRQSHQYRRPQIVKALTDAGNSADLVMWVAEQFDQHNGQALQLARYDMEQFTKTAEMNYTVNMANTLYPAAVKALGAQGKKLQEEGYHNSWDENGFIGAVIKHAREGMLTPAQSKKERDEAVVKATAKMRANGGHPAGRTSAAPTGARGAGGRGPASLEEAQQMHSGMHSSGRTITNAQMRSFRQNGHI